MILRMSTIVSSLPGTELTLLLPARELPFRWLPDVPTVPVELQATFGSGGAQRPRPVLIGLVFIVLGIAFGDSGYALLKTIPTRYWVVC